jgi:hypothetical protein
VYDALIQNTSLVVVGAFLLALVYLLVGLIRPSWARASKRRWVLARAVCIMLLAVVGYVGVIAYTHAQPDGPHSIEGYLNDVPAEQWEAWRKGQ